MIIKRSKEIQHPEEHGNRNAKLGKRLRSSLYALCLGSMLLLPSQSFAATDLLQGITATPTTVGFSNPSGSTDVNDSTSTDLPAQRTVWNINIHNYMTYVLPNPTNISSIRIKLNYSILLTGTTGGITFHDSNGNQIGSKIQPNSNDYVLTGLNYANVKSIRVSTSGAYSSTPLKVYSFEAN